MERAQGLPRPWPLVWWLSTLVAAVWLFTRLGSSGLAAPPVGDVAALGHWIAERSAAEVVMSGLRVLVLALAWYLLGVTTFGLVARFLRAARLVAIADVVTVPAVRRVLESALGLGLAAAAVTSLPAGQTTVGGAVVVREAPSETIADAIGDDGDASTGSVPDTDVPAGSLPLPIDGPVGVVGADPPPRSAETGSDPATGDRGRQDRPQREAHRGHATPAAPDAEPPGPGSEREGPEAEQPSDGAPVHTIAAGEHLWSIAENALRGAWDRTPTESETAAYWRDLIARNRQRLPDPGNPDLVHPGLEIRLPDLPRA